MGTEPGDTPEAGAVESTVRRELREAVAAVEWCPVDRVTGDDVPEFTRTDVEAAEATRSARA